MSVESPTLEVPTTRPQLPRAQRIPVDRRAPREVAVRAAAEVPPLGPRLQLVRAVLVLVCLVSTTLLLQLTVISSLQHSSSQARQFDRLRQELAVGTAPIGPTDADGAVLPLGTPVAYLEAPAIGLQEVIGEGTTSNVLFEGAGHRRDTPLPGQIGTSIVLGRRAAFGGPFSDLSSLRPGDPITVTTGQGTFTYKVVDVRAEGDPLPPALPAGSSRLVLVTAAGRAFLPDGVLRVDADLDGVAVVGPARLLSGSTLPHRELPMEGDTSTLWAMALWVQALLVLAVGVVVAWKRWGRGRTWVVFLPPLVLVSLCVSGEVARLLPNLL